MGDSDVYANLSRILETHSFGDEDGDFDSFVTRVTTDAKKQRAAPVSSAVASKSPDGKQSRGVRSPAKAATASPNKEATTPRPTPYEMWQSKQSVGVGKTVSDPKIQQQAKKKNFTGKQWDAVVDNLYRGGQSKYGVAKTDPNSGYVEELGKLDFKPKMNKISLQLSRTMKPLMDRIPTIVAKKQEMLQKKKEQYAQDKFVECTFVPERQATAQSNKYLKKSGRDTTRMRPEDLFRYEEEKQRRLEERRKIVKDLEAKEFTFQPKLNATSVRIKDEAAMRNAMVETPTKKNKYDETVAMTKLLRQKNILAPVSRVGEENSKVVPGKIMVYESSHPYPHNANDFRPIWVDGALAYSIIFDEDTRTEQVYDFIKFYQDDGHDIQWGAGKYSGGHNKTTRNFPGTDGRAALLIPASRFVLHFKSNNRINNWGYKMFVTPYFGKLNEALGDLTHSGSFTAAFSKPGTVSDGKVVNYQFQLNQESLKMGKPTISTRAQGYTDDKGRSAHVRLYEEGKKLQHDRHNEFADQMARTMKGVEFRPWEVRRGGNSKDYKWTQYNSHARKELAKWHEYITPAADEMGVTVFKVVDFKEFHYPQWKTLREAKVSASMMERSQSVMDDPVNSFLHEE